MKVLLITTAMIALFAYTTADRLTGRWETKPSINGNITGVVFKPDNSFEGYINKKPFTSGNYTLQDTIFTFTDNGCAGMQGVYAITFFSNGDSIRFKAISDSCVERMKGIERTVLGKVK